MRPLAVVFAVLSFAAPVAVADDAEDAVPRPAHDLLRAAFDNLYDCDRTQIADLIVRDRGGSERLRRVEIAVKLIEGRMHSLGRFTEPTRLRNTAILTIEAVDRSDDHFVYLPSLKRSRRVSSSQRSGTFMGTDLTFEDIERRRPDDYAIDFLKPGHAQGEPVHIIRARPVFSAGYDEVEFHIAKSDSALLLTRYFKRTAPEPFKTVTAMRESMSTQEGHILPTVMLVQNFQSGSETEVRMNQLRVNPTLDDHLFSIQSLEVGRKLIQKTP